MGRYVLWGALGEVELSVEEAQEGGGGGWRSRLKLGVPLWER